MAATPKSRRFWRYIAYGVGAILAFYLIGYLFSLDARNFFACAVFIYAFLDLLVFQNMRERKRDRLAFDNRVLATIDGLYLSGVRFGCTDFEMRSYAKKLLEKAHALPSNQTLLDHTISARGSTFHGSVFRSHTGLHGDHITFALLCIIEYAKDHDNQKLVTQCEQFLIEARHMGHH